MTVNGCQRRAGRSQNIFYRGCVTCSGVDRNLFWGLDGVRNEAPKAPRSIGRRRRRDREWGGGVSLLTRLGCLGERRKPRQKTVLMHIERRRTCVVEGKLWKVNLSYWEIMQEKFTHLPDSSAYAPYAPCLATPLKTCRCNENSILSATISMIAVPLRDREASTLL